MSEKCACDIIESDFWNNSKIEYCPLHIHAKEMLKTIHWMAQTVHQAYHIEHLETIMECPKDVCNAARQIIVKAEASQ